jgi:hypothetical protein
MSRSMALVGPAFADDTATHAVPALLQEQGPAESRDRTLPLLFLRNMMMGSERCRMLPARQEVLVGGGGLLPCGKGHPASCCIFTSGGIGCVCNGTSIAHTLQHAEFLSRDGVQVPQSTGPDPRRSRKAQLGHDLCI